MLERSVEEEEMIRSATIKHKKLFILIIVSNRSIRLKHSGLSVSSDLKAAKDSFRLHFIFSSLALLPRLIWPLPLSSHSWFFLLYASYLLFFFLFMYLVSDLYNNIDKCFNNSFMCLFGLKWNYVKYGYVGNCENI